MRIRRAKDEDHETLCNIWLKSVRATHSFLSEEDLQGIIPAVWGGALRQVEELWVLEADEGPMMGFTGLTGNKMEALFLAPEYFRRGGGRLLVEHARARKGPLLVDVNEQNPEARKFYESMGFVVEGRSKTDEAGRPFPLLHMRQVDR